MPNGMSNAAASPDRLHFSNQVFAKVKGRSFISELAAFIFRSGGDGPHRIFSRAYSSFLPTVGKSLATFKQKLWLATLKSREMSGNASRQGISRTALLLKPHLLEIRGAFTASCTRDSLPSLRLETREGGSTNCFPYGTEYGLPPAHLSPL